MGDPATAGLILSVVGVVGEAASKAKAGKEEDKIRKQNAAIIEAEAQREARAKGEQAREKRLEGQRLEASQIVAFAKSGVRGGTGTSLLVRDDSRRRIEQQARIIQEQGTFARETGTARASLERRKGRAARKSSRFSAGTSLATGFGSILATKRST